MSSIEQRFHHGHHTVTFTLMSPIAIIPWGMQQYNEPWRPLPIDLGKISLKSREVNTQKSWVLSSRMLSRDFEVQDILFKIQTKYQLSTNNL
jgi:hypothetical protein